MILGGERYVAELPPQRAVGSMSLLMNCLGGGDGLTSTPLPSRRGEGEVAFQDWRMEASDASDGSAEYRV